MKLTSTQRSTLQYYQQLHGTQPSMWSLVARYWWRYLLALVVGVAAPAVLFGSSPITFLLAGLTLGVVTRDLSRYRAMAGMWPVIEAVFDWDKIDALLAGRQDP